MCVESELPIGHYFQMVRFKTLATLEKIYFMEPKEAVYLKNEEMRLSDNEKIEEQVILSLLTSEIARSIESCIC